MSEPLVLGEKILSLLDEASTSSTYKPALLLALIDRASEFEEGEPIPVEVLAERVIELYWQQTLEYPDGNMVLRQNQAGGQAKIIKLILGFRSKGGFRGPLIPGAARSSKQWQTLVFGVEKVMAEMPVPRLQVPYEPFIYEFDWEWAEKGKWSVTGYKASSRAVHLLPGARASLISLGPLLRPFITRWWIEKAARLNQQVKSAESMLEFERFLFGRERKALDQVREGLADLQGGSCLYCGSTISGKTGAEVDHFVPWSYSGDDGLDNLVVACRACNGQKSANLAGPEYLESVIERNQKWQGDLLSLSEERNWPKDLERTDKITRSIYLLSPAEKPVWLGRESAESFASVGSFEAEFERLLGV
jgi:5-methylcytosine-specific restriction endonuclease McrA